MAAGPRRPAPPSGSRETAVIGDAGRKPRSRAGLVAFGVLAGLVVLGLIALGTWQVERRTWKLDLIARVDQRVHASAVAAPGPIEWPSVTAARDEYRRVSVTGTFLNDRETLTQAVTERGGGYWVLTPLRRQDGTLVLVNRGFVPTEQRDPATRRAGEIAGETTVVGLLRLSEPRGTLLRSNDPAGDRWFSRDVPAIAAARGLSDVAPYFIDADNTPNPGGVPVGGLTVTTFPNSHLVYAITWYVLALMAAAGAGYVIRDGWSARVDLG
jgi:surfeit locus 1 family protein